MRAVPLWTQLGWKASELCGDVDFPVADRNHIETISLISCHHFDETGRVERIHDSCAGMLESQPLLPVTQAATLSSTSLSHYLYFWAQTARIKISREPMDTPLRGTFTTDGSFVYHVYVIIAQQEVWRGNIALSKAWREQQSDLSELIAICCRKKMNHYEKNEVDVGLDLMSLESRGDTSARVQLSSTFVSEDLWQQAQPTWRVVPSV